MFCRNCITNFICGCFVYCLLIAGSFDDCWAGELSVISVEPAARTGIAPIYSPVTIRFDQEVEPSTVNGDSFRVFGEWSGAAIGSFEWSDQNQTVVFQPSRPFSSGEMVFVVLSRHIVSAGGDPLRSGGYSYKFMTRAKSAPLQLEFDQFFSTNRANESSTPYGGLATDLNSDGYCDLTIINESTDDLRVFMNLADSMGTFEDFSEPTIGVGEVPSPSVPADFDNDGQVDLAVANTVGGSVSILLGNGDGTFGPQQEISLGGNARGIAVLDVEGDGDLDIAATAATIGRVAILLNDGSGVFGAPAIIDAGISEEWALGSADMNEDGLMDLVVGGRGANRIAILLNDGDGTFTISESEPSGGRTWMINVADVNGDGHNDVVAANSSNNNGGVLFGDGTGQLGPVTTYVTDPFALATDLGDLDGDGDLDWVTSSFNGDWYVFINNGTGGFSFLQELPATIAASCALLADVDNDRDLDVVLVDEIADELWVYKNSGTTHSGEMTRIEVNTGVLLAGGLSQLEQSDDDLLRTRSGFGSTLVDLHNMEMVISATTANASPNTLHVSIESSIGHTSGTAQVAFRDWNTGNFVSVGQYAINNQESTFSLNDLDATRFVGPNGEIELRLRHLVFVPFLAFTFESRIDHVELIVE